MTKERIAEIALELLREKINPVTELYKKFKEKLKPEDIHFAKKIHITGKDNNSYSIEITTKYIQFLVKNQMGYTLHHKLEFIDIPYIQKFQHEVDKLPITDEDKKSLFIFFLKAASNRQIVKRYYGKGHKTHILVKFYKNKEKATFRVINQDNPNDINEVKIGQ